MQIIYLGQLDNHEHNIEMVGAELQKRLAVEQAEGSLWPSAEGGWLHPGMFHTVAVVVDTHGGDGCPFFLHS